MAPFDVILALLVFGHALADYPLQGDFLARGKNRKNPIPGIPFYQPLIAHATIHGGFVGIITGSVLLGVLETVVHAVIDDMKCTGKIDYDVDQALHIMCKIVWTGIAVYWIG